MKLSIIIPALNEERYLPELLESIRKQNFQDYEIIVADAGSEDNTVEIVKSYGGRIVKGGSPAKGRNEGAKAAKADLLLFLDADLILPKGFLQTLLNEFEKRNLDIVSCSIIPGGNNKLDQFAYIKIYRNLGKLTQRFLPHASGAVILVKKNIHRAIEGFDEEVKFAEDHYYARLAKKKAKAKFGFLDLEPVLISSRRLDNDGRAKTYLKYIFGEIHLIFWGPIKSDIFRYRFNHYAIKNQKGVSADRR